MPKRRHTDIWITSVRRWLGGMEGPSGEQLALPGMPEPPQESIRRLVPFVLVTFADHDGTSCRPTRAYIARVAACSPDTIQRTTVEMERLGLLHRVNRAHRGEAQEWVLTIPEWLSGSHKKGRTSAPLSEPNGVQGHPRKGRTSAPPPVLRTETSSDDVAAPDRARSDDATDKPAWSAPLVLDEQQKERNRAHIAAIRAQRGWGPVKTGPDEITPEKRDEAIAEYEATYPETVAPNEHTESHATH